MSHILIKMKDGTTREFKDEPRAGGSYEKRLTTDGPFAVVTDEYYRRTLIPAADILEIKETPRHV